MANIFLTSRCNLRCPYCFAHDYTGGGADEKRADGFQGDARPNGARQASISEEAFDAALEFVTRTGPAHIGLIGGEPTAHPRFAELARRAAEHPLVSGITVYTNGILVEKFADLLAGPKFSLLVNWNSPTMLPSSASEAVRRGVDRLVFDLGMRDRVNLGLNIYGDGSGVGVDAAAHAGVDGFDYSYMLELLRRYGMTTLRISLTVPEFPAGCGTDVLEHFRRCKPLLWRLFHDLDDIGVQPYYDCNRPPACIWTDEERAWLMDYAVRRPGPGDLPAFAESMCKPVVDILPDLTAIRCFAMGDFRRVPLADFADLDALRAHFMREIDRRAYRIRAARECENCHLRRTWRCCQGCMGYKMERIAAELDGAGA